MYYITHHSTGHSYIIDESDDKIEVIAKFNNIINNWGEPDEDDEFLDLWTDDGVSLIEHNLTDPDTWEDC